MIVIVGGSGFVGTRLCRRLAKKRRDFLIVDKAPSAEFESQRRYADVRDLDSLRKVIPQEALLINLAAEHRDDVRPLSLYHEVNVLGAKNLCAVAEEKSITRIIFTSSVACYGFAPANTGEDGVINPFNEYGRTKAEAEVVYRDWQSRSPDDRGLVIVRPTVIFGEQNRGNVYNLLRQIASGRFFMIGDGRNVKSMAYVENVAAFIEYMMSSKAGCHLYNYVDKPDMDMNTLVSLARRKLGKNDGVGPRLPYALGYAIGLMCDAVSRVTGWRFPISAIRVKKFCGVTQFSTSVAKTGFVAPVPLQQALDRTIQYEFFDRKDADVVFFSE